MSSEEPEGNETLIASVQRALRLVDIVANSPRPLPAKVLAQQAGLTLGTTYNLVRTLVRERYLTAERDGLVLGGSFPALSDANAAGVFVARVRESLHEVADGVGATAYLSRYDDGEVHLVDIVDAESSPRVELWVGLHSSAHATALGKQILAELSPDERADYLSRHALEELTPYTIRDRRLLLRQLERPAAAVVRDEQEYAIGYNCLAVPVRAPGLTASLAISLPTGGPPQDTTAMAEQLRRTANRLSLRLGADGFSDAPSPGRSREGR
ncbi:IclR family transcriptional regulator C-terminal domain-containing protein [Microbacterium sp. ARD32]|uniref:IclR family transcriptional regulator n=1 Tax=Microbacterium sp. ARD32 TaxID=2962577 RepID=UPI002882869C|nr:IclR family transcriptional regulator C-terminal domain-containing protein [Microbacterium sp. ARD32]MDT0157584.1 IclR family transcriptional regulator C-terminal domain-containing protein [Microbacterium sp. ARD32]